MFKRVLFGYRVGDVEETVAALDDELVRRGSQLAAQAAAIRERDQRIADLDGVATHLSELVVIRERELRALRGAIEEIRAQARGYATRVRMQALRQAAALAGGREAGNGSTNGAASPANLDPVEPAASPTSVSAVEAEKAPGIPAAVEAPAAIAVPIDAFEGSVELEVGPFDDFAQLVGFEDAASGIGATSEVSVKRFSRGRATLNVRLDQPVDLLRELEERAPFEFKVRSLKDGRLILDLGDG